MSACLTEHCQGQYAERHLPLAEPDVLVQQAAPARCDELLAPAQHRLWLVSAVQPEQL